MFFSLEGRANVVGFRVYGSGDVFAKMRLGLGSKFPNLPET